MKNFKKIKTKFFISIALSGIVLGSTVLNNVFFNKVFAMQEAEENVEQNFLETEYV